MENRKGDFPPKPVTGPHTPLAAIFYLLFSVLFLYGCAAPAEPIERKPPTPNPVNDLNATQAGNDVTLAFTLPRDSVEKRQLRQSLTIQVYRDFEPAPANPTLLLTIPPGMVDHYTVQGRVRFVDSLRAEDFAPSGSREALYRVRTFVSPKKLSADSNVAALTVYPVPDPIADLKAEIAHPGVTLSWTPPQKTLAGAAPRIAFYRVYRAESEPESSTTANPDADSGTANAPENSKTKVPFARIAEPASPPYTDTLAQLGKTYIYTVRSVSQYPNVALESADSNFATVTAKDIFPPSAPQNLVVVFVPAVGGAPANLELSWAINPETDIAGYNVYRSESQDGLGTRVNSELLLTPAFRDMNVVLGRRYFYTVFAVDRSGNESPASAPASGSVPAESQ
ncbi:MAG: fibronectin type III domain-containing protein [Candidatus Acidiferrales bacterium]